MNPIAVKLTNISKSYPFRPVSDSKPFGLNWGSGYQDFWALRGINLTIRQGEQVAIIGPNGAGKTTLLRLIAGITPPSSGTRIVNGSIVSLTELLAGFQPELSGHDNIFLNGVLLGASLSTLKAHLNDIVAYADLKQFIDQPFYTFSSGMKFRLAFAIAKYSACDILLMDELFSYSDQYYQEKMFQTLMEFKQQHRTLVFSTHMPIYVWRLSTSCYRFNQGALERISRRDLYSYIRQDEERWRKTVKFPLKPFP